MAAPEVGFRVPCTCGELFQGTADGAQCLVSCPIDCYSEARANGAAQRAGDKVRRALAALGLPAETGVIVETSLPVGRGYGTSTADIGSALFAAAARAGVSLDGPRASRVAAAVEPTDSTLLEGIALFDHRGGTFHELLGRAPRMSILILDAGGFVDTDAYNAVDRSSVLASLAAEHRRALDLLRWGMEHAEPGAVGEAATRSAVLHQSILPNPLVETAQAASREAGALGICRAHSGTVVGLLFDARTVDPERARSTVAARIPGVGLRLVALVDGGPRRTAR